MQILICSHDGVQDQVVDPVQFQTTWAIYRILRYTSCRFHALDFFLSTWQIHSIPCDFTNSSSSKMSAIPFGTIPFQKQHPYPTRWFTEWQWAGSKSASHTRNLSDFSSTSWKKSTNRIWSLLQRDDVVLMPWCPPLLQDSQKNKANCKAQTLETKESGLSFYLLNEILNIEIPSA